MLDISNAPRPQTILIVDDEAIVLDFCRAVLTRAGYNVFTAARREDALNYFGPDRSPIDLVLLDVVMPGIGALEFIRRLQRKDISDARIALMSGYSPAEINKLLGTDASNYKSMWKPFVAHTFVRMVQNLLEAAALIGKSQAASVNCIG